MAQSELSMVVEPVCKRLCDQLGYELVDIECVKESAGRYLRIFISKPDGISLNDCEVYHRAIIPLLDAVEYDFLEVGSPGIDRPLKKQRDFDSHAGKDVEVRLYKPIDGHKQYEGALVGLVDGIITIDTPDGFVAFAQKNVSLVKPIIVVDDAILGDDDEGGNESEP